MLPEELLRNRTEVCLAGLVARRDHVSLGTVDAPSTSAYTLVSWIARCEPSDTMVIEFMEWLSSADLPRVSRDSSGVFIVEGLGPCRPRPRSQPEGPSGPELDRELMVRVEAARKAARASLIRVIRVRLHRFGHRKGRSRGR